jgi:hypothetical protein
MSIMGMLVVGYFHKVAHYRDVSSIDNCERLVAAVGQKRLDGSKLCWGI